MGYRRDQKATAISERDEPAVEEVVDAGCQQQPVFGLQAVVIVAVVPRPEAACAPMRRPVRCGCAAALFEPVHVLVGQVLSGSSRFDGGLSVPVWYASARSGYCRRYFPSR